MIERKFVNDSMIKTTGFESTDSKWNSHLRNIGQRKNTPRNQICGVKLLLINYQAE